MKLSIAAPQFGALADAELIVDTARQAEALGYHGMWVADRVFAPIRPSEPYPASADGVLPAGFRRHLDPLAVLTFVAANTSRLRLGTSVLAMPCYSAIVLARQLAAIDVLSSGRLTVGLGGGWSTDELHAVGGSPDERGARSDEFIETMVAAWTNDVVSYQGRFEHVPECVIDLKPVQRPHPPILLAAYAPASMQRVARLADGWNPAGVPIALMGELFEGIRVLAERAGRDPGSLELVVRANIGITDDPLGSDRADFTGSLAQVIDDVRRCEEIGAHEVLLDAQFGAAGATPARYTEFVAAVADELTTVPA